MDVIRVQVCYTAAVHHCRAFYRSDCRPLPCAGYNSVSPQAHRALSAHRYCNIWCMLTIQHPPRRLSSQMSHSCTPYVVVFHAATFGQIGCKSAGVEAHRYNPRRIHSLWASSVRRGQQPCHAVLPWDAKRNSVIKWATKRPMQYSSFRGNLLYDTLAFRHADKFVEQRGMEPSRTLLHPAAYIRS